MGETIELGGNISLAGFTGFDSATMIIVKKIVGNYGKKFSELCGGFENLNVSIKPVHQREKSEIYEITVKLQCTGKSFGSKVDDRNLFVALDQVLKKIQNQII